MAREDLIPTVFSPYSSTHLRKCTELEVVTSNLLCERGWLQIIQFFFLFGLFELFVLRRRMNWRQLRNFLCGLYKLGSGMVTRFVEEQNN